MFTRPVAITCPHCGADLEVQLPIQFNRDEQIVRAKFPDHHLAESSKVSVAFDLAGSVIAATLAPLCPLAGAKLTAPRRAVTDAVDRAVAKERGL